MPPRRSIRDRVRGLSRREPLPSLHERHPRAASALRRRRGLQVVALDQIVGTVRNPSQNTVDFMPLPYLRGRNWNQRWQRIQQATDDLSILPAIDLVRVGDEYYVADGHNRVAAALQAGAVAIDADVTELVMPGERRAPDEHGLRHDDAASLLHGADELRQAAAGRQSRTAEHRPSVDELRREQLTGESESATQEPRTDDHERGHAEE